MKKYELKCLIKGSNTYYWELQLMCDEKGIVVWANKSIGNRPHRHIGKNFEDVKNEYLFHSDRKLTKVLITEITS